MEKMLSLVEDFKKIFVFDYQKMFKGLNQSFVTVCELQELLFLCK